MRRQWSLVLLLTLGAGCGDSPRTTCPEGSLDCPCKKGDVCTEGVCDAGECREALTCDACVDHQSCTAGDATTDATCLAECEPGWVWNEASGTCDASALPTCTPGAPASIDEQCTSELRECVEGAAGALCGDCLVGTLEEGTICRPVLDCDDCADELRECAQPAGDHTDAVCGACLPGYVDEDLSCRAIYTCDTLPTPCTGEDVCMEATETADAFCVTVTCPSCDGEGELGVFPALTTDQKCICRTDDRYFYSTTGSEGTFPCDRDEDGWVRDTASFAVSSSDPVVRENARCTVRKINRFVLHNVLGEVLSVPLAAPLDLYETERNDDPDFLASTSPPSYNPSSGRALHANEINSLTKACVSENADHNHNELPDIEEWGRPHPTDPGQSSQAPISLAGLPDEMRENFEVYTRFSYFVELFRGWYEDPAVGETFGAYHIREKTRAPEAGDNFALRYGEIAAGVFESDYWQDCPRARDAWYSNQYSPITMDFASVSGPDAIAPEWSGMMHHSQFKCVQVSESAYAELTDDAAKANNRHIQSPASIIDLDWDLNVCEALPDSVPAVGRNPEDPILACDPEADPSALGLTVLWAAVRIAPAGDYERGCVIQCAGQPFLCPGQNPTEPPRPCWHMCGDFVASEAPVSSGSDGSVTWSVRGEVPAPALDQSSMSATDTELHEWTIRPQ